MTEEAKAEEGDHGEAGQGDPSGDMGHCLVFFGVFLEPEDDEADDVEERRG